MLQDMQRYEISNSLCDFSDILTTHAHKVYRQKQEERQSAHQKRNPTADAGHQMMGHGTKKG